MLGLLLALFLIGVLLLIGKLLWTTDNDEINYVNAGEKYQFLKGKQNTTMIGGMKPIGGEYTDISKTYANDDDAIAACRADPKCIGISLPDGVMRKKFPDKWESDISSKIYFLNERLPKCKTSFELPIDAYRVNAKFMATSSVATGTEIGSINSSEDNARDSCEKNATCVASSYPGKQFSAITAWDEYKKQCPDGATCKLGAVPDYRITYLKCL